MVLGDMYETHGTALGCIPTISKERLWFFSTWRVLYCAVTLTSGHVSEVPLQHLTGGCMP